MLSLIIHKAHKVFCNQNFKGRVVAGDFDGYDDTLLWQLIKTTTGSSSNSAPSQTYLIRAYDTDLYWISPQGR